MLMDGCGSHTVVICTFADGSQITTEGRMIEVQAPIVECDMVNVTYDDHQGRIGMHQVRQTITFTMEVVQEFPSNCKVSEVCKPQELSVFNIVKMLKEKLSVDFWKRK